MRSSKSVSANLRAPHAANKQTVAADLAAVSFGGLVLGRRLHAVSADNSSK